PPRVGDAIDGGTPGRDLVVGQQVPGLVVERRAREERHFRVAVHEDLAQVVLELVAREVILAGERGVPVLLGVLREVEQPRLLEVVADEVRLYVDDELSGQRAGALRRHTGLLGLGAGDLEDGAEDVVHGEEGRGHAGAAGQERPAAQAVARTEVVRQLRDARLDALLLARLRQGVVLTVRDDLGGNRKLERVELRGRRLSELMRAEIVRHRRPSNRAAGSELLSGVPPRQALRVGHEEVVHLPHRGLGGAAVLGRLDVAEDRLLRLARLLLLDRLVHRVVGGAPVRSYAVMLHERLAHGASDLYHLLLEERGRAQRRAPGYVVRQSPEERDDG